MAHINFQCNNIFSEPAQHVESGGFLNILFFLWIIPLVKKGMKKTLEIDDINMLPEQMKSPQTWNKLKVCLHKEYICVGGKKEKISLFRVYLNFCFGKLLVHVGVLLLGETAGCIGTVHKFIMFFLY